MPPVARLAPSPTGALHLGNARSFLIAWLSARSQVGRIILRIEDIDSPRVKPGAVQQIYDDFRWLGLDWDGEPIIQTDRLAIYEQHLDFLKRHELVYPCTCSRTDIERAASAPHLEHEAPRYPGTCQSRRASDASGLFAWRLRTEDTAFAWEDLLRGPETMDAGGDFVVWKSAGSPAYQLAVVVDDALMGVTEVVRGDDLVPSTPRQMFLYRLFGWMPPRFGHVPLVVGTDGRRLAKRHGDWKLATLRDRGVSAETVLGWLAASCGWLETPAPITIRELLPLFRWETIPRRPIVIDGDPFQDSQAPRRGTPNLGDF